MSAASIAGTSIVMTPEQLRGGTGDRRCDVYALGATLDLALAQRPPIGDFEPSAMFEVVASAPRMPLRVVVPDVDADLGRIVIRCHALIPDARLPTVADELTAYLTGSLAGR